ncbi:galectin-4-like [Gigantopelta aegis]|uniref:galectin-4-like n=1 Tax=Gigantopelta aegis TaxID=1735272 RepID=UPI001B88CA00|nr:galectin-4-like [Gigantopelta aegis]
MSTIVNPPVPYSGVIPGGLNIGRMIIVQAKVPHHQNSFSINLCVGPSVNPLTDTGLHFNPRFSEGCVVRNSFQFGVWANEERHGGMPLQKGAPFEIIILVNYDGYKISVNGKQFTNFRHRLAKESLYYLVINGGIEISFIKFEGGNAPPPYSPPQPGIGFGSPPFSGPAVASSYPMGSIPPAGTVYNPPVPYVVSMPGGLYPGRMIFISGVPLPNPSRFSINLQCGPHEHNDVGMVFDARFNFGGTTNVTVRNHKVANNWGSEERHGSYFPFAPQSPFDMIIMVEPTSIKVAVNNQHFCEFYHRIQPMSIVNWLNITGDVQLTSVRIQ